MKLSKRVCSIQPSLTLSITAKANQMKSEGVSIIGFGAGEPDFNTPDYIVDAAKKALDDGMTKYTPASGIMQLKQAICNKFKQDNGLEYSPEQIVISNGAKHSLHNAIFAIIDEGDEVLVPSPFWLTYPELVGLAGGKTKYIVTKEEEGFKLTPEALEAAITKKTKLLILNSPNNPTGAVYTEKELRAIADVILSHKDLYVISDEIYEFLVYGEKHFSIASINEEMYNRTIVVNGVSKTYAMTGWRIGYLAAPLDVAKAISSLQSHATSNPNTIAQYATVAALSGGKEKIAKMREVFDDRRKFMVERINSIDGISCKAPSGAFYVMVNITKLYGKSYKGDKIINSINFADALLTAGVAAVPGVAFGADDFIRLSYAISKEDIAEGLDRIEKFIKELV